MNNQVIERELGWEDEITNDGEEFILLPPGEYTFVVKSMERARFNGSDKMPACPQANVTVEIIDPTTGSPVSVVNRLLLHTKTEWTISAFFQSIGLKKKGEPLKPNWSIIVGLSGKCKIKHRDYNGSKYNEIDRFLPREDAANQSAGYSFD